MLHLIMGEASFRFAYEFEVLEMDSRRILKVKFTILPKEETEGAEDKE